MNKYIKEKEFINSIKTNDDFVCSYVLTEDSNVIWIVIKDARYEFNVKYIRSKRQFETINNCKFEIILFSDDEIEGINEQLMYMGEFEYIGKS